MQVFKIENRDKEKLTVILEPWAEEFYVKKGQVLELQQEGGLNGYYHQWIYENGDIQVFVEAEYDYPKILLDGKEIEAFNK